MTEEEKKLNDDLIFWQKQLRLQDWNVKVSVVKNSRVSGRCRYLGKYKEAEIEIADPDTLPNECMGTGDFETILVHELLHIQAERLDKFVASEAGERYEDDLERWIELTAIALVALRRK